MKSLKKLIAISAVAALMFSLTASHQALAQTTPTSTLKKAVEDIKDNIETLITAKDEGTEDLAFRVETFKKVINLSLTEAKDLKIKLIALENEDEQTVLWKKDILEKIAVAIKYFEGQKSELENQKDLTLAWIKTAAQNFKNWREQNYLPVASQGFDFLLIQQENKAVETAQNRLQKIKKDLENLKKYRLKNIKTLNEKLTKATQLIEAGAKINEQTEIYFWQTVQATSTEDQIATSSETGLTATTTITATASSSAATSTPETADQNSQPSIRDLVKSSLNQIKEAYQIFIEMSNLVRDLLK